MEDRFNLQCVWKCQSEPMNFPRSVSPSEEMGDRTRQRKNLSPRRESSPRPPDLISVALSTELHGQAGASHGWCTFALLQLTTIITHYFAPVWPRGSVGKAKDNQIPAEVKDFSFALCGQILNSCRGSPRHHNIHCRINSPFCSCVLSDLALAESEAGVDLVLIQTSLLFICISCCSYANYFAFTRYAFYSNCSYV